MDANDARFRMLFYETGIGISLVDMDRRITEVNPAFEQMTGYTNDELRGKTFAMLMHPEDNRRNLDLHEEMLAGKRTFYNMQRRYIRKDGAILWTRLTVCLFRDAQGRPQFTMGTMEDITEGKMAEEKLREQQNSLVQASKMSALGEMAGGIAHEIQTPLTIIRFRAESLKTLAKDAKVDPVLAAKMTEHADSVEKTVVRISTIVKGLRAFARKGEQDPFQQISFRQLLDETLELCRDKFKYHGVDLKVPALSDEIKLECRPTQISQVFVNLLNNAFDAIQPHVDKWVNVEIQDTESSIEISLTDSGKGLPKEVAEKLFVGSFTTKPVGKGTGLGLSISKSIVESHGGSIRVDTSAPNTRFVIVLPKRQADLARAA